MILHFPFEVGSRLLPSLKIGDGHVSLEAAGCMNNRLVWRWFVDIPAGNFSDCDLFSAPTDTDNARGTQRTFAALLSFLGACGESEEHRDLFPDEVGEWVRLYQDEIDMLKIIMEETPNLLEDGNESSDSG